MPSTRAGSNLTISKTKVTASTLKSWHGTLDAFSTVCYYITGPRGPNNSYWFFWYKHPHIQIMKFLHVFSITALEGRPFWSETNELRVVSRGWNFKAEVEVLEGWFVSAARIPHSSFTSVFATTLETTSSYAFETKPECVCVKFPGRTGFVSVWLRRVNSRRYRARAGRGGKVWGRWKGRGKEKLTSRSWLINTGLYSNE